MRQKITVVIKLVVAASLLAYLLTSGKIDLTKLARIKNWGWIALAQVLYFTMLSLTFIRWKLLLNAQGIRYSIKKSCAIGFIGFFFNQFVPGSTGGDLVKAYYVAVDNPELRVPGIMAVFLDRIIGLLVLMGICGFSSVVAYGLVRDDPNLSAFAICILAGLTVILCVAFLFFNERVRSSALVSALISRLPFRQTLNRIQESIYHYKRHSALIISAVVMSVGVHVILVFITVCYALALGPLDIPLSLFFFLVPLATLAMAIPLTPGGLGVGEFAYIELFNNPQVGYSDGDALVVLYRLSSYAWALVGIFFFLARKKKVRQAMDLASSDTDHVTDAAQ